MDDLKVGDRVYFATYFMDDIAYALGPKNDQKIKRIETITFVGEIMIATLEDYPYIFALKHHSSSNSWRGDAMIEKGGRVVQSDKVNIARAIITTNYIGYSREKILFLKEKLSSIDMYDIDWNGNRFISWTYAATLTDLKRTFLILKDTSYEELYPEDFI